MPLYRPSELQAFLKGRGAKRSLSQNFLVDGNIVKKIVDTVPEGQEVLEIGPGPGVVTEELIARGFTVTAVEKDHDLGQALKRFPVEVHEGDICGYQLSKPVHVVGNLPYGISKEICHWLISQRAFITQATLMVQREFAEKLQGKNALSIMMQYVFDLKIVAHVSPNCFWPRPKVTSSILVCTKRPPQITDEERFFAEVQSAFQHRRKKLKGDTRHVDELGVNEWIKKFL